MPEKILSALKEKMSPWVKLPPDHLTSLQYNFDLNGVSKHIEVVKGKQNDSVFYWRGISLYTGLEQILDSPDSYELSVDEKPDVLNDKVIEESISKEADEKTARKALITDMLDHNKPWLEGKLEGINSIQYTHRTIREDMDEACYVDSQGVAIMEITRDGKGKLPNDLGNRKIVLSDNDYYISKRGEKFATPRTDRDKRSRPAGGEKIRGASMQGG